MKSRILLLAALSSLTMPAAQAALTSLADAPLITAGSIATKPNLFFVLDDSGSMGWDYLPDWVDDSYCKRYDGKAVSSCSYGHVPYNSPDYNSQYYNPEITYTPPKKADGTNFSSYTSWTSVPKDAYGIQSTSTLNLTSSYPDLKWCTSAYSGDCKLNSNYLYPDDTYGTAVNTTGAPFYYRAIAGEYCDSVKLTNCVTANTATGAYLYPARLRWCKDTGLTECQAIKTDTYKYARYPTVILSPAYTGDDKAKIKISGNSDNTKNKGFNLTVLKPSSIGPDILTNYTQGAKVEIRDITNNLIAAINAAGTGYSASLNGTCTGSSSTCYIDIVGSTVSPCPSGSVSSSMTSISASGANTTVTISNSTSFPGTCPSPATYVPGSWTRTNIVSGGTFPRAAGRTDCAADPCTYDEEMTNFANWYAYYRTRMQMMKSSASLAFQGIDDRYRVGYFTLSAYLNSRSNEYLSGTTPNKYSTRQFVNIADFDATRREIWYNTLFRANPSVATPLRQALSYAGQLYANQISGQSDPVEYSCQQNFTILSTDGYWNEQGRYGKDVDGNIIDDADATAPRPYYGPNPSTTDLPPTLADVAYYYYQTDIRNSAFDNCQGAITGVDVCTNNVPGSGLDQAAHQHMTTFTLGLGIDGYMMFDPSYQTATSGDYYSVRSGASANPSAGICSWQSSGACDWPTPKNNWQSNIDDLWHAAVNGRGTYFSAKNPSSLVTGLSNALAGISARTGAAAAAATSSPNVTSGDNFVFSSTFRTVDWTGDLVRRSIDVTDGSVNYGKIATSDDWSAQVLLDANTPSTRSILTYKPVASGSRQRDFLWASFETWEQTYYFDSVVNFSQWTSMNSTQKADSKGENLLKYLRGDTSKELKADLSDANSLFRVRAHILGDIVSSEAAYVKVPPYSYADHGYDAYKTAKASRQAMTYVGANDGMLHAFNADTGAEVWAYIPSPLLPKLWRLADRNYATSHAYYTDGTPTAGDICTTTPLSACTSWKTIIVGGLNGGGRGYYAIDITNPASPTVLWEFIASATTQTGYTTSADLGYTYGNPVIAKIDTSGDNIGDRWVVMVASGYNNVTPGDGEGHLYILDALSGSIIDDISTSTGDTTTPSGLARIAGWADDTITDNTVTKIYGGDLDGNLWRFNVQGTPSVSKLAVLKNSSGNTQPITVRPELGQCNNTYDMVYVGTGKLLGTADLSDTSQQTFYGIKDSGTTYSDARAGMVQQTLTDGVDADGAVIRTGSSNDVDLTAEDGWYVDLPDPGERDNTDPTLALGTIVFTTNVPNTNAACSAGGDSWIYYFDYCTGKPVITTSALEVATKIQGAMSTRPVIVRLPDGQLKAIDTLSTGQTITADIPVNSSNTSGSGRAIFWRELIE